MGDVATAIEGECDTSVVAVDSEPIVGLCKGLAVGLGESREQVRLGVQGEECLQRLVLRLGEGLQGDLMQVLLFEESQGGLVVYRDGWATVASEYLYQGDVDPISQLVAVDPSVVGAGAWDGRLTLLAVGGEVGVVALSVAAYEVLDR